MIRTLLLTGLALSLGVARAATEIVPATYVVDQATDCGLFCYHDAGGELTDGRYGALGWGVDLGSGPAAEWVGWLNQPVVNIDFDFGTTVAIDTVAFGSTQNATFDVVLPTIEVFQWSGGAWQSVQVLNTPESEANSVDYLSPGPHGFLTLSGLGIVSDRIRVQARHASDGPWTFVDEVDFYAPVPEPGAGWLVLGAVPVVLTALRRRQC